MAGAGRVKTYYLLDSDAVIDYLGGIPATVQLLGQLDARGDVLCLCDIVVGEVFAGLLPKDRPAAQPWLPTLAYLPTTAEMAQQAGAWKYDFARRGITLALTDCLIAATAHGHQATLITGNVRDFPMPELSILRLPRANQPR